MEVGRVDAEKNIVDVDMSPIGDLVAEWEVELQALQDHLIPRIIMSTGRKAIYPVTVLNQGPSVMSC